METISTAVRPHCRAARTGAIAALLLAGSLGLAGCSSAFESGATDGAYGEPEMLYDEAGGADASYAAAEESEAYTEDGSGDATLVSDADRAVIVTGSMAITVDDPSEAAQRASDIVEGAGGRIDAREEQAATEYQTGWASLTLRIPADKLDTTLDDLRELGEVDNLSTSSYDVSTEVQDVESQIATLEQSITRIRGLIAEAEDLTDLIYLEDQLANREAELQWLEARQRGLDDQVAMSTIHLGLYSEDAEPEPEPGTFLSGLQGGWDAFIGFWSVVLVVLGAITPWLVLAALIALAAWLTVRFARRRRTDATADAGAGSATEPTSTTVE